MQKILKSNEESIIDKIIQENQSICILGHIRPDGDCVGSTMGMYHYIKDNYSDKEVDIYLEYVADEFSYIDDLDKVINSVTDEKVYDLAISLDVSSKERMGEFVKYYDLAKKRLTIDHHVSNKGFGDVNILENDASSCSEVLASNVDMNKISKNAAKALYTGIIHDSGVFKYQSTTNRTMLIAGQLMDKGIDFTSIIDESFYSRTYIQSQILGKALMQSVLLLEGKVIYTYFTGKDMKFYNTTPSDVGGIVEQLRLTKGVECAIFIYETGNLEFKVSLRSKEYMDVNKVASNFGGGGHTKAAGCTLHGNIHDVLNNVLAQVSKQLI